MYCWSPQGQGGHYELGTQSGGPDHCQSQLPMQLPSNLQSPAGVRTPPPCLCQPVAGRLLLPVPAPSQWGTWGGGGGREGRQQGAAIERGNLCAITVVPR